VQGVPLTTCQPILAPDPHRPAETPAGKIPRNEPAIDRAKTRIGVHFQRFRESEIRPQKTLQPFELKGLKSGTPGGTRIPNLLIRSHHKPLILSALC